MKKVLLLSITLMSALFISSCGAAAGLGDAASAASGTSGTSTTSGVVGSCTNGSGTNAICVEYSNGYTYSSISCGSGTTSSSGCSTSGMIGKCVINPSSYTTATYYGSGYSSYGSSLCSGTWTSLSGTTSGTSGTTGTCSGDPAIYGTWKACNGSACTTMTFNSTCTTTLSMANGCSGSGTYSTSGGVATAVYTTVSPASCGTAPMTSSMSYVISGGASMTVQAQDGSHTYQKQ